jgi:preprotein translocase subunit SecE
LIKGWLVFFKACWDKLFWHTILSYHPNCLSIQNCPGTQYVSHSGGIDGEIVIVAKKEEVAETKEATAKFNINDFFKGTKEELDKVVWPSRQQLISESVAVILMVILSATTIYLIDNLFTWASKQVF